MTMQSDYIQQKQRNEIALRLYRTSYNELPELAAELVDDVVNLITASNKAARIDELERTLPFGKQSKLYKDRVKELTSDRTGGGEEQ